MTYYNRSQPFTTIERKIQNEQDLISFLIESKSDHEYVLMHSPTHAFLFRPSWLPSDISSSILSMNQWWANVDLRNEQWLAEKFSLRLPFIDRSLFLHRWRQQGLSHSLEKFRVSLIAALNQADGESLVDAFLYESLPLIDSNQAAALVSSSQKNLWRQHFLHSNRSERKTQSCSAFRIVFSIFFDRFRPSNCN